MKLSGRELILVWATSVALILGITYWFGEAKVARFKDISKEAGAYRDRVVLAQRLLDQREESRQSLEERRAKLPQHAMDKDVTAELLKTIEQTAQQNGLILLRREPESERNLGNLYEVSINCTWEGSLDQLVGFLYAVQSKGAILDIQQLTVTPSSGKSGQQLKGSFTIDCAYSRGSAG